MRLEFDWDPGKAASNFAKHGVAFEDTMAIFLDPLSLSRLDDDRGSDEERWVTLGLGRGGRVLLVVHTHRQIEEDFAVIRIISARLPTRRELIDYQEG
jgi:uncharacterized DUF497 family protein